jgi:hypothetical protein
MNDIIEVTEGAYFVPCYSEQTVVSYQPGITAQTIVVEAIEQKSDLQGIDSQANREPEQQWLDPHPIRAELADLARQARGSWKNAHDTSVESVRKLRDEWK